MAHEGRVLAISKLIKLVGPAAAADMVRAADRKHQMLYPTGCASSDCPVCTASRDSQAQGDPS